MSRTVFARAVRVHAIIALVALVAAAFVPAATVPAFAQERAAKPWSLRDMLFFTRKAPRVEPEVRVRKKAPAAAARKKTQKPRKSIARAPVDPPVVVAEKLPEAKVVLVIGDFVGAGTAEGLNAVFATNPRVKVVDRTNGASGFARSDYFDWPGSVSRIIDAEKPSVVVFAIGANDRQQMKVGDGREPVRSQAWTTEYTLRAEQFAKAVAQTRVPLIWVGTPAFKSSKMNSDMLALNEIVHGVTSEIRGEFVDVWDGFVDENGAFVTTGPDINGQPVRLRAGDGINFTAAGKRKLAFYVEKPLKKVIGETGAVDVAALPSAEVPAAKDEMVDVSKIVRTTPISLSDPSLDGGGELMGMQVVPRSVTGSPGERLAVEGIAPLAAPGRADDFAWPPRASAATATIAPSSGETTTAIGK